MASDSSFDIVSKVDRQEADNALNQAHKEVEQRYDFKGTDSSIELKEKDGEIDLKSVSEDRLNAVRQVLADAGDEARHARERGGQGPADQGGAVQRPVHQAQILLVHQRHRP